MILQQVMARSHFADPSIPLVAFNREKNLKWASTRLSQRFDDGRNSWNPFALIAYRSRIYKIDPILALRLTDSVTAG